MVALGYQSTTSITMEVSSSSYYFHCRRNGKMEMKMKAMEMENELQMLISIYIVGNAAPLPSCSSRGHFAILGG